MILIVDDQPIYRLLLSKQLQHFGVPSVTADGGKEALELVVLNRYDLIILDVIMPELSGIETTSIIRSWEHGQQLTKTYIVGMSTDACKSACKRSGMDDYMQKPVLLDSVSNMLGRYQLLKHSVSDELDMNRPFSEAIQLASWH